MKNDFFAVCEIVYLYDDGEQYKEETEYIVLTNVCNYSETMSKVEDFYRNDLRSIKMTLLEHPHLTISKEIYDKILEKNGENV
jgi:hypothetical protein